MRARTGQPRWLFSRRDVDADSRDAIRSLQIARLTQQLPVLTPGMPKLTSEMPMLTTEMPMLTSEIPMLHRLSEARPSPLRIAGRDR
jgi:hypothetical protein